jgi:hypothetical protein
LAVTDNSIRRVILGVLRLQVSVQNILAQKSGCSADRA